MLQELGLETAARTDYTVRAASPADTPRIVELLRRALGEGRIPRDEGFWRWKHEESPFGPSPCLVAEAGGEIIGLRAFMRWQWQVRGTRVDAVRAVDTATHVRFRGRGIFSRLTMELVRQMHRDGVSFVYNTPNRFSLPGYLKMGWKSLGRTSLWLKPRRPLKLLDFTLRRSGGTRPEPAPADGAASADSSVTELLNDPHLADVLGEAGNFGERLSTRLTAEYLAWRYARIPGFSYGAHWEPGHHGKALIIYRLKPHGGLTELRICELVIGRGVRSRRAARRLIGDLLTSTRCDVASAAAHQPGASAVLLGAGFVPVPQLGPTFTVRPLHEIPCAVDPLQRCRWAASIGDLEIF